MLWGSLLSLTMSPSLDHVTPKPLSTAVFAGGCFWSVEAVFEHVRGVTDAVSGFSGASLKAGDYVRPFRGTTGYAETVKVTYDSTTVSYEELLRVFFTVAHDPTEVDRQGPDDGAEYRSVIFFVNDAQRRASLAYIDSLEKSKTFKSPIATQVAPFRSFRVAAEEHQNFVLKNPNVPYVVTYDLPKLEHFRHDLPALFREH
jgi:peptide-methionine (S)-S-oxide reductase